MLLHHGITTFLRSGDFSLIKLRDGISVAGIGELKTTEVSEQGFSMQMHVIFYDQKGFEDSPKINERNSSTLDPKREARLKRQLESIRGVLAVKVEQESSKGNAQKVHSGFYTLALEEVINSTTFAKAGWVKADQGLLLMGMRFKGDCLANRLLATSRSSKRFENYLSGLEEKVIGIMDESQVNKPDNANSVHFGELGRNLLPGTLPLPLWPIEYDCVEELLFFRVRVTSFYNPAHLIKRLRAFGIEVDTKDGRNWKGRFNKGEHFGSLEDTSYFQTVVSKYLLKESFVFDLISQMIEPPVDIKGATVKIELDPSASWWIETPNWRDSIS